MHAIDSLLFRILGVIWTIPIDYNDIIISTLFFIWTMRRRSVLRCGVRQLVSMERRGWRDTASAFCRTWAGVVHHTHGMGHRWE